MILIRGRPRVLFPLSYNLRKGVSTEEGNRSQDNLHQQSRLTQHWCPLRTFLAYFVYVIVFVNNVKFVYVEHSHLWSLNLFFNPLLQNLFQVKCLIVY